MGKGDLKSRGFIFWALSPPIQKNNVGFFFLNFGPPKSLGGFQFKIPGFFIFFRGDPGGDYKTFFFGGGGGNFFSSRGEFFNFFSFWKGRRGNVTGFLGLKFTSGAGRGEGLIILRKRRGAFLGGGLYFLQAFEF